MSKFKVGDVVRKVSCHASEVQGYAKIGSFLTIKEITYGDRFLYWFKEVVNGNYEHELDFNENYKDILNSPLYKVLKEETNE